MLLKSRLRHCVFAMIYCWPDLSITLSLGPRPDLEPESHSTDADAATTFPSGIEW